MQEEQVREKTAFLPQRHEDTKDHEEVCSCVFVSSSLSGKNLLFGSIPVALLSLFLFATLAFGFQDIHGEYPDIVRAVAAENKAPLIDMHRKSEKVLRQYGAEGSRKLFLQLRPDENANYPKGIEDNTHFSPLGADIMAGLAVEGIRELKLDLAKNLRKSGAAESK